MTEPALTSAIATVPSTEEPDYLTALVGADKKYKSHAELARAYINADLHIQELRDKLDDRTSRDQRVDEALAALRTQAPPATSNVAPATVAPAARTEQAVVPPEAINTVVEKVLEGREAAARYQANVDKTFTMLEERYGSREAAATAVNKFIGNDPNLKRLVDDASRSNPDACLALLTGSVPPVSTIPNTPGVDKRLAVKPLIEGSLTYALCKEIRKSDPKRYNSKEFRTQMETAAAAALAKGVDFFAT
jgi:hypothetical protein